MVVVIRRNCGSSFSDTVSISNMVSVSVVMLVCNADSTDSDDKMLQTLLAFLMVTVIVILLRPSW